MYRFVEDRIKESMDNGDFDNLPGKGKRLQLREELQGLSPEIRSAYKILKNAGYIPEEADKQKEKIQFHDMMHYATDGQHKDTSKEERKLELLLKGKKTFKHRAFSNYANKIFKKLF
ncbi:DUF1992 domain-containing protein [Oceanobacillus piezotolerans]|uniref:DUF1992 domain-containing protein n=1 Tax=Oceanobacillus piezotolerans TaxID=2448030 RepID=A0A498D6T8_9BACI|nr:DUF1992 domain-containing protein [Oceanobacillus piezotolerans]RLL41310.1 DUF1992 domain-containing protein [Oceanobacillus piezotolerans]